jgi:hypothetical protein
VLRQSQHDESAKLAEIRNAIRKLLETNRKLQDLMAAKLQPHFDKFTSFIEDDSRKESIESMIQHLAEATISLIKIMKKREQTATALTDTIKRFEHSDSVSEISTLIGFTLLTDYKGYLGSIFQITKICESRVFPTFPKLENFMQFSAELDKFSKWLHGFLNCDDSTGEDDVSRMITAIRDLDLNSFNKIYEELDKRIELERSR